MVIIELLKIYLGKLQFVQNSIIKRILSAVLAFSSSSHALMSTRKLICVVEPSKFHPKRWFLSSSFPHSPWILRYADFLSSCQNQQRGLTRNSSDFWIIKSFLQTLSYYFVMGQGSAITLHWHVLFPDFDQGQCDSVCECHLVLQGASHLHLLGCCLFLQHMNCWKVKSWHLFMIFKVGNASKSKRFQQKKKVTLEAKIANGRNAVANMKSW